jgi:hypothetical protein
MTYYLGRRIYSRADYFKTGQFHGSLRYLVNFSCASFKVGKVLRRGEVRQVPQIIRSLSVPRLQSRNPSRSGGRLTATSVAPAFRSHMLEMKSTEYSNDGSMVAGPLRFK